MTLSRIPVMAQPLLDPGAGRITRDLPHGLTVAQIVATVLPHADPAQLRVTLTQGLRTAVVGRNQWRCVRPHAGVQVMIRLIPGNDQLRSVLLAVVSVAALALAPAAAGLAGITSQFGVAAFGVGLSVLGGLLVNALIPVQSQDAARPGFAISGWRNEVRQGAPVPYALGKHRYAPPFAATSYTEISGDEQYVRALFCFGYGPLRITDLRLGETPIDQFDGVDMEIREGRPDDLPVSLYPRQVLEETFNAELIRPLPRGIDGAIEPGAVDADAIETPLTRFSAADASQINLLISLPQGLFQVDSGGDLQSRSVSIRIRARLNGVGGWTTIETLALKAKRREPFVRTYTWTPPTRGRWQIELTRMSAESPELEVADRTVLAAIQSIRPEYPIALDKPLALVALRIKATFQLNGALDDLNALVEREALVPTAGVWAAGYSRTPAVAYVAALTGPANQFPAAEAEIDWDQIADWHEWCVTQGLKYDRVHDQPESLGDMLAAICAAGRATPRHDGVKWGVVIDRPQTLVVDHINPRNSAEFSWSRTYFDAPDAFRVPFLDETNDYLAAERIVPWPGHTGSIDITESLEMPGKTNPHEIWIEARRRMYELIHRPDSFSVMQDGAARVATRGDLVMGSFDVLSTTQVAARVTSVAGNLIEIDEELTLVAGTAYGLRFRVFADAEDTIGTSIVRPVASGSGPVSALLLTGSGPVPAVGEAVHVGPIASESFALRVRGIEAGEDFAARLLLVAAAPEIDDLIAAEVVPAWDGRYGEAVSVAALTPLAPLFTAIASGAIGTGDPDGLEVLLRAQSGSAVVVTGFRIDHRLVGATTWTTISVSAAAGGAVVPGYAAGDAVELRALADASGTPGPYTAILTVIIGSEDPAIPAALDSQSIMVTGGLGHADLSIAVGGSPAPAYLQIYRVPTGDTLDPGIHQVARIAASPNTTTAFVDGDATRQTLIADGSFANPAAWTAGTGWTVASGVATHVSGALDALSQALTLTAGAAYRWAYTRTGTGDVVLRFDGTTDVDFTSTAAGQHLGTVTAPASTTAIALRADTFAGTVDDLVVYRETAACVDAGTYDYWIEPQNAASIPGPVAGPFTVTII
jgi:hypothetical protein